MVILGVAGGVLGVLSLFWSERGMIDEFSYPRDGGRFEGLMAIATAYGMMGWLFSVAGALITVPRANQSDVAAALLLTGISFAAMLRLYALGRSFSSARITTIPPAASEVLIALIAFGFGFMIIVAIVGDLSGYVESAAGTGRIGVPNQPFSLLLLGATIVALVSVEWAFKLWRESAPQRTIARQVGEMSVKEVLTTDGGGFALQVYMELSREPITHTPRSLRGSFSDRTEAELREALHHLFDKGLIVAISGGGYRRQPHFFREQRDFAAERLESIQGASRLTFKDVEALLRQRRRPVQTWIVPPALRSYTARFGEPEQESLRELLDLTIDRIRDRSTVGKRRLDYEYLNSRYWDGLTAQETARLLNYSREHLIRKEHRLAVEAFKQELINNASLH
jgi:hypothetical protein